MVRPACSAFGLRARVPAKRRRSRRGGTTESGGNTPLDAMWRHRRGRARVRVPRLLLRSELAQRLPNELLNGRDGSRTSCESALGVTLAEAKASERLKGFRPNIGSSWGDGATVGRAVRVRETRRGRGAGDDEPALVDGEVVGSAKRNEIFGVVISAF